MSFTRYHDDPARIAKNAQQTSDVGRYVLNVPGNGVKPCFMNDPNIRMQKWGANLRTNSINLESDLMGLSRNLNLDTPQDNYSLHAIDSKNVNYPVCNPMTSDPRTTHPAWQLRSLETSRFDYLPLDPQKNVCYQFQNNLNTSLLERETFKPTPQTFRYL